MRSPSSPNWNDFESPDEHKSQSTWVLRFYDPTEGRILVNGTDLRELDLDSYYARISVIFQEFAHYDGRVREQIGYGQLEYLEDLEYIRKAARISGAETVFEELPKRYDTPLGK